MFGLSAHVRNGMDMEINEQQKTNDHDPLNVVVNWMFFASLSRLNLSSQELFEVSLSGVSEWQCSKNERCSIQRCLTRHMWYRNLCKTRRNLNQYVPSLFFCLIFEMEGRQFASALWLGPVAGKKEARVKAVWKKERKKLRRFKYYYFKIPPQEEGMK